MELQFATQPPNYTNESNNYPSFSCRNPVRSYTAIQCRDEYISGLYKDAISFEGRVQRYIDFMNIEINFNIPDGVVYEYLIENGHLRIMYDKSEDWTYYFIDDVYWTNPNQVVFKCKTDMWLTYWLRFRYNTEQKTLIHRKMSDRYRLVENVDNSRNKVMSFVPISVNINPPQTDYYQAESTIFYNEDHHFQFHNHEFITRFDFNLLTRIIPDIRWGTTTEYGENSFPTMFANVFNQNLYSPFDFFDVYQLIRKYYGFTNSATDGVRYAQVYIGVAFITPDERMMNDLDVYNYQNNILSRGTIMTPIQIRPFEDVDRNKLYYLNFDAPLNEPVPIETSFYDINTITKIINLGVDNLVSVHMIPFNIFVNGLYRKFQFGVGNVDEKGLLFHRFKVPKPKAEGEFLDFLGIMNNWISIKDENGNPPPNFSNGRQVIQNSGIGRVPLVPNSVYGDRVFYNRFADLFDISIPPNSFLGLKQTRKRYAEPKLLDNDFLTFKFVNGNNRVSFDNYRIFRYNIINKGYDISTAYNVNLAPHIYTANLMLLPAYEINYQASSSLINFTQIFHGEGFNIIFQNDLTLITDSNPYNNYFQQHINQYNNSIKQGKLAIKKSKYELGTGITKGPGGFGTGAFNLKQSELQLQALYAKRKDLMREPLEVNDAHANESYTLFNKNIFRTVTSYADPLGPGMPRETSIAVQGGNYFATAEIYLIPEQQQNIVADYYYRHGYGFGELDSFTIDNLQTRYIFDYYEIPVFSEVVDKSAGFNIQILRWFNDKFAKGVRLWHSIPGVSSPQSPEINNYNYENWEVELFQPINKQDEKNLKE